MAKTIAKASTKIIPQYATKVCPQCGSRCFADMDTCYGCLHHFGDEADGQEVVSKKKGKKKSKTQKSPFEAQELLLAELIEELQRRGFSGAKIPATLQLRSYDDKSLALALEIQIDR